MTHHSVEIKLHPITWFQILSLLFMWHVAGSLWASLSVQRGSISTPIHVSIEGELDCKD